MAPLLEHCFTLHAQMPAENIQIGTVMGGPQRFIGNVTDGWMEGKGLERAELVPPSGDWMQLDPASGTAHFDVRCQVRTKEGHVVYITYHGTMTMDEKGGKAMARAPDAKTTEFGDHEFFTTPKFETSDPNLKWIENGKFVGEGRFVVEGGSVAVEYAVYHLRPNK